jgi:prolyl-tRNA synthetase
MFADADLFGVPVRVVVSPKTCERGVVEISYRDKSFKGEVAIDSAVEEITKMVNDLMVQYDI